MNNKVHILLAEDEPSLGMILKESLESRGYEVHWYTNGSEAIEQYHQNKPDILVLDIMMPEKDGLSLAKEIRLEDPLTPILFLTSKSETKDVLEGFYSGGNDYLKKPFSMEELMVRIQALLNRFHQQVQKDQIRLGRFIFNAIHHQLRIGELEIALTHRESELLYLLYINRNQVLNRSVVLKKLWGDDDFFNARSMDVFITKLRKKLSYDPELKIVNIRGFGYQLSVRTETGLRD